MPLVGDARRRRVLDRLKAVGERDRLNAERLSIRDGIAHALHTKRGAEQRVVVEQLKARYNAVHADWQAARARAAAAAHDLGEPA